MRRLVHSTAFFAFAFKTPEPVIPAPVAVAVTFAGRETL
jgi:hypothetical protein